MDIDDEKSGDQMDILTMIQHMGKFPEFFQFTELPSSAFAFATSNSNIGATATSHLLENPYPTFPSSTFPSTLSFNSAAHSLGPPSFPPYSTAGRWRTHAAATENADTKQNSMAAMREMIYRIAAMQPIHIDPESVKPPKRRNVKISKDPQSVAARHRRERISERIRILQRIVPGGTKMDTASMLDEAIHYVKFLKNQVQSLEIAASASASTSATNRHTGFGFPAAGGSNYNKQFFQIGQRGQEHVNE